MVSNGDCKSEYPVSILNISRTTVVSPLQIRSSTRAAPPPSHLLPYSATSAANNNAALTPPFPAPTSAAALVPSALPPPDCEALAVVSPPPPLLMVDVPVAVVPWPDECVAVCDPVLVKSSPLFGELGEQAFTVATSRQPTSCPVRPNPKGGESRVNVQISIPDPKHPSS